MNSTMIADHNELSSKPRRSRSNKANKTSNAKKNSVPTTIKAPRSKKSMTSTNLEKTMPSTAHHFVETISNHINMRKSDTLGRPRPQNSSNEPSLINL